MPCHPSVAATLQSVDLGQPAVFENLTIVPLLAPEELAADYLTLDEALEQSTVEIGEVGRDGHVPELIVVNRGDRRVLLLDGEELIGAKQNRVLNLTLLVPAHKTMAVPVSCVEAGRWRRVSSRFASAPRVQFAEGRAAKMRDVTASLESERGRYSDQGAVWDLIAEKSARLDTQSATSAMSDIFDARTESIEAYVGAFPSQPGQAGAVFLIDGRIAGLELFDSPATWRKVAPKLVRSYALDAIDRRGNRDTPPASSPDLDDVRRFVGEVGESEARVFEAVGEGEDVRLSGPSLVGAALCAAGGVVHLSAFATGPQPGEPPDSGPPHACRP